MNPITTDTSLVAYYPHIIGSGSTLYDYSSSSNNGTITNGTWQKNTFNGGYHLNYNASSTYVNLGSTYFSGVYGGTNTFTAIMWFKTSSASSAQMLWTYHDYWAIRMSSGQIQCTVAGTFGTAENSTNTSLNDGNWHHVVYQYDGTNANLYIDGNLDVSNARTLANPLTGSSNLGRLTSGTWYFDGNMDEHRFSTNSESPEEIKQIYNQTYRQ